MNEQINEAIKSIEVSLKALTGAEEIPCSDYGK